MNAAAAVRPSAIPPAAIIGVRSSASTTAGKSDIAPRSDLTWPPASCDCTITASAPSALSRRARIRHRCRERGTANDRHASPDKRQLDSELSRNLIVPHFRVLLEISEAIPDLLEIRLVQRANFLPGNLRCRFFRRIPFPQMKRLPIGAMCWLSILFICVQSASDLTRFAVPSRLKNWRGIPFHEYMQLPSAFIAPHGKSLAPLMISSS